MLVLVVWGQDLVQDLRPWDLDLRPGDLDLRAWDLRPGDLRPWDLRPQDLNKYKHPRIDQLILKPKRRRE